MGCTNCPPAAVAWLECQKCKVNYKPYEGLYHSMYCPRCQKLVLQARAVATAHRCLNPAAFLTNLTQGSPNGIV